jgi:hypothetical protein
MYSVRPCQKLNSWDLPSVRQAVKLKIKARVKWDAGFRRLFDHRAKSRRAKYPAIAPACLQDAFARRRLLSGLGIRATVLKPRS